MGSLVSMRECQANDFKSTGNTRPQVCGAVRQAEALHAPPVAEIDCHERAQQNFSIICSNHDPANPGRSVVQQAAIVPDKCRDRIGKLEPDVVYPIIRAFELRKYCA
jgi:hypothetical protein